MMLKFGILLALGCVIQSYEFTKDEGYENHYKRNSINQLIIGNLIRYSLKRSLIQFQNLPSKCTADKIIWARMQLSFVRAHAAGRTPLTEPPWLDYILSIIKQCPPSQEILE